MSEPQPQSGKNGNSLRAREILEREIRLRLRPEDNDKFVVIDVDSEDYELGVDQVTLFETLRRRQPQGQFFLAHVERWWVARIRSPRRMA